MSFEPIPPNVIIEYLRTKMSSFSSRVAGAATYDSMEDSRFAVPCCFVMLGNNGAETLSVQAGIQQRVGHSFDIVLYLNPVDVRKQEAEDVSVAFKRDLIKYLNGWVPDGFTNASPLEFVGDQLHPTTPDRYARIYQFAQNMDFLSSIDGDTDVYNALPDFESLIGPIVMGNDDTDDVGIQLTNLDSVPSKMTISGTGTAADETLAYDGLVNDKISYTYSVDGVDLVIVFWDGNNWILSLINVSAEDWTHPTSTGDVPDQDGWGIGSLGSPAPTIVYM